MDVFEERRGGLAFGAPFGSERKELAVGDAAGVTDFESQF
jgi:hypothetical protein